MMKSIPNWKVPALFVDVINEIYLYVIYYSSDSHTIWYCNQMKIFVIFNLNQKLKFVNWISNLKKTQRVNRLKVWNPLWLFQAVQRCRWKLLILKFQLLFWNYISILKKYMFYTNNINYRYTLFILSIFQECGIFHLLFYAFQNQTLSPPLPWLTWITLSFNINPISGTFLPFCWRTSK